MEETGFLFKITLICIYIHTTLKKIFSDDHCVLIFLGKLRNNLRYLKNIVSCNKDLYWDFYFLYQKTRIILAYQNLAKMFNICNLLNMLYYLHNTKRSFLPRESKGCVRRSIASRSKDEMEWESLRLEKTFKISKFNHHLTYSVPSLNNVV